MTVTCPRQPPQPHPPKSGEAKRVTTEGVSSRELKVAEESETRNRGTQKSLAQRW